ncbi:gamma-glutamyl phosphate reductase [Synechococcus sp. PCC 7502]|uniref:gamma-glutamyl-phosphate reductase n=1 Tax=Synechococcus sp. PCC 7502 TaxID=1173263 RepID=UPI00029FC99B|nr:gamma-glutamyl-phosphate reductase [Synechococcus sp. PCC 7502]AFY74614.1 gamma-glutamyl phosphate reductase [Synechococcus sp. PCC 7502]
MNKLPDDLTNFAYQSYTAGLRLASLDVDTRNHLLFKIADAIKQERNLILEANTYDLEASREMAIPDLLLEWMRLTPDRLHRSIDYLKHLVDLPDPLSRSPIIFDHHYRSVPLGSVAFVYEALPHLVVLMAGLCLKSANSLILRGGSEISLSQTAITEIIKVVIKNSGLQLSDFTVAIAPAGSGIKDLVTQEKYIRLVIPYGRPSFVQQIGKQSTLSIIPAAMGNCYMYLSPTADADKAVEIIKASRQGDPDAVNAIEKVVVHSAWLVGDAAQHWVGWVHKLQSYGLKLKGCDRFVGFSRNYPEILGDSVDTEIQWGQSYLDNILAIKIVDAPEEAIAWINQYSSGHADVIMSDSVIENQSFVSQVKSSNIFINAHSKFHRIDGNRVALGIASLKTRGISRYGGIIDLQSLTTTKRIISL